MKTRFSIGFIVLFVASFPTYGVTPDMVYIPGGTFAMGDSLGDGGEIPVQTVTLDSFYIGKYEITNQQYCDFLNWASDNGWITVISGVVYKADSGTSYPYCDTHSSLTDSQIDYSGGIFSVRTKSGRSMTNDPMVAIMWYGAVAYCNWLSQQEEKEPCYNLSTWEYDFSKNGYRLPTEAEWEYAARGGLSGKRFPWGDEIYQTQANYDYHPLWNDGICPYTSPVGFFDGTMKYKADYQWPGIATSYQTTSGVNNYGLYDMAGNAWEWCNDWYGSYSADPQTNPTGPTTGSECVHRGGGAHYDAWWCRVAARSGGPRGGRDGIAVGFRVASVSKPTIQATIDIDQDTLNLKSKGKWITCYIELPEGYDVTDIDVSTIMLNDQVPAESKPTAIADYDGDGINELMVKFSRSAVQNILPTEGEAEITVVGELSNGTTFEGKDTIRVINPGK